MIIVGQSLSFVGWVGPVRVKNTFNVIIRGVVPLVKLDRWYFVVWRGRLSVSFVWGVGGRQVVKVFRLYCAWSDAQSSANLGCIDTGAFRIRVGWASSGTLTSRAFVSLVVPRFLGEGVLAGRKTASVDVSGVIFARIQRACAGRGQPAVSRFPCFALCGQH